MGELAAAFADHAGVVASFDDHEGVGVVTSDATGETWPFHCTRIADGSRAIPVGVGVTFRVEPGPTGLEAVAVAPLADGPAPT